MSVASRAAILSRGGGKAGSAGKDLLTGVQQVPGQFTLLAHAWNCDRTLVACSCGTESIVVYNREMVEQARLLEHTQPVTALSWAPTTNLLLSTSEDRNAYVWTYVDSKWVPRMVLLRIGRAATCCAWSPDDTMFVVGTSDSIVCVCFYQKSNQWWASVHLRTSRETDNVSCLSVAWLPDNKRIVSSWSDGGIRMFTLPGSLSGKVKTSKVDRPVRIGRVFGTWCHGVAASPDGSMVAFASHDSRVSLCRPGKGDPLASAQLASLPITHIVWISPTRLIVGGFDGVLGILDVSDGGESITFSGWVEALPRFSKPTRSSAASFRVDTAQRNRPLATKHQGQITSLNVLHNPDRSISGVSSTCTGGSLVTWTLPMLKPFKGK